MNFTTSDEWTKPAFRSWQITALIAAVLVLALLELAIGSVGVPFRETLRILFEGQSERETWTRIILLLRLPRTINAAFSGAAIGA